MTRAHGAARPEAGLCRRSMVLTLLQQSGCWFGTPPTQATPVIAGPTGQHERGADAELPGMHGNSWGRVDKTWGPKKHGPVPGVQRDMALNGGFYETRPRPVVLRGHSLDLEGPRGHGPTRVGVSEGTRP